MGRAYLSGGQLVSVKTPFIPTPEYSSSWFPSMPPMSGGWWNAYSGVYEKQLWVYVLVNKLAKATARLPLPVYQRTDDDSRERVPSHPLTKLLQQPNPKMSGFKLWRWTSSMTDIYGEAFWLKRRKGGRVAALFPLHPTNMVEQDGAWTFDNGTTRIEGITDADLVHFNSFSPTSLTRGLSPLEPLRSTLENEWHARTATSSFWQRGARPGMYLSHPQNLSGPAQERLRAQVDAMHSGSSRTGSTFVLEEGITPHPMTLTAEEAQYIETRKLNREEVCAAYDVPPPVVHILDRATFSNITEQMRSMYRDTMAPRLKEFEAAIEIDLRLAEWPDDDVYAEFLMDEVLRGDFEARQDALGKATHMTIAEKRRIENLPFIDGTDRIFLNSATLPLDAIDAQYGPDAAPQNVPPALAAPPEADPVAPKHLLRTVLGRLGWQKTLADVNPLKVAQGTELLPLVERALNAERAAGGNVAGLRARLGGKAPTVNPHQEQVAAVLRGFFARQPDLTEGSWDPTLTNDLHKVAVLVSAKVGRDAMKRLGYDPNAYDTDVTLAFLLAVCERYAVTINDTTRKQLEDAEDRAAVFKSAGEGRADGVALAVAATVAGFAEIEAGSQASGSFGADVVKTWVTGPNPRPEHAAMNGETVPFDEPFSNGMGWPGEGGSEDIGCNCSTEVGNA